MADPLLDAETIDAIAAAVADRIGSQRSSPLLTAAEVAALLGVPTSWVYAETRAGRIPSVSLGRYRRYRREAIEAWIEGSERGFSRSRPGGNPHGKRQ
jgi:excisionase family DNA binding protein